jgi:hypothetical protein
MADMSAIGAPVRVDFEGVVSRFDAGYEAILSPSEKITGSYTLDLAGAAYTTQQFFGVPATSFLLTDLQLLGQSGWKVESSGGVVLQTYVLNAGGPSNGEPNYQYSVLGGRVSFPSSHPLIPDQPDSFLAFHDLNGNGVFDEGEPVIGQSNDVPDFYPIEAAIPVVWNPMVQISIHGPYDWLATYSGSPLPPPLAGSVSSNLYLSLEIFVPFNGLQQRTAVFDITSLRVVPEPSSRMIVLVCVASVGHLRRRCTSGRQDGKSIRSSRSAFGQFDRRSFP